MYTFFLGIFRASVALGVAGYVLVIAEVMGVGALMRPILPPSLPLSLLWYGIYFGILGRDCAEVAADRMVSRSQEQQILKHIVTIGTPWRVPAYWYS